jgi:hypothetical protein
MNTDYIKCHFASLFWNGIPVTSVNMECTLSIDEIQNFDIDRAMQQFVNNTTFIDNHDQFICAVFSNYPYLNVFIEFNGFYFHQYI